jgi:hypothetical protein
MTTKVKRWIVGLVFCFLLVASPNAWATYAVIENISQNAPDWGDCNCIDATGWLGFIVMGFTIPAGDGTTDGLTLISKSV